MTESNSPLPNCQPTNATIEEFQEFDYVIIGGGTSGLTCGATLSNSTSSKISIGILEAGDWKPNDPLIDFPSMMAQSIFNPQYDWCLQSIPQENCDDRQWILPRGKMLGGSSGMNFLCWQRGYRTDFDDIAKLGNPGWDWDSLTSHYDQITKVSQGELSEVQKENGCQLDVNLHGNKGPIEISEALWFCEAQKAWWNMMKSKGLKEVKDGSGGGEINGLWNTLLTVDNEEHKRVYSANAFYEKGDYSKRENYKVLTGARVTKIEFDDNKGTKTKNNNNLCATGVTYIHNGKEYHVKAKREVILSAGTYLSPQILELSGIGNETILKKYGILTKVNNQNVGNNYQEHMYLGSVYEAKEGLITFDKLKDPKFAEKAMAIYTNPKEDTTGGILATSAATGFGYFSLKEFMTSEELEEFNLLSKQNDDQSNWNEGMKRGHELQLAKLFNSLGPAMEVAFLPAFVTADGTPKDDTGYMTQLVLSQYPLSRGNVHIQSNDPLDYPAIDPKVFSNPADLRLIAIALKKSVENMEKDQGLSNFIVNRHSPNKQNTKTIQDYENYVKQFVGTTYHPVGTCSMMPREMGGVVDPQLRVYGTQNLRVVDASILPIMPAGHIQAACYIIGHKAAKMISQNV